jgi:hypothetical protein
MEFRFERLQFSQRSSMLRAVLLPPFETGMMWSYSKFFRLPHFTHLPPSLRQTSLRIADGIASRFSLASRFVTCEANIFKASSATSSVITRRF